MKAGSSSDTCHCDLNAYWRDDLIPFVIGCSFAFEHALQESGISIRHIEQMITDWRNANLAVI